MCPLKQFDFNAPMKNKEKQRKMMIYALSSQIKLCRDYEFFGGHFLIKCGVRGHENIL